MCVLKIRVRIPASVGIVQLNNDMDKKTLVPILVNTFFKSDIYFTSTNCELILFPRCANIIFANYIIEKYIKYFWENIYPLLINCI